MPQQFGYTLHGVSFQDDFFLLKNARYSGLIFYEPVYDVWLEVPMRNFVNLRNGKAIVVLPEDHGYACPDE